MHSHSLPPQRKTPHCRCLVQAQAQAQAWRTSLLLCQLALTHPQQRAQHLRQPLRLQPWQPLAWHSARWLGQLLPALLQPAWASLACCPLACCWRCCPRCCARCCLARCCLARCCGPSLGTPCPLGCAPAVAQLELKRGWPGLARASGTLQQHGMHRVSLSHSKHNTAEQMTDHTCTQAEDTVVACWHACRAQARIRVRMSVTHSPSADCSTSICQPGLT
jgi:hypothetical protein